MRRSRPTLPVAERHNDAAGSFSFVSSVAVAVFAFLTLISAMAGYYSKDDEAVVAFVVTSYLDLSLLICSLWYYNKSTAQGGSSAPSKKRRASSVWALTTLLTFCFAFMVGKAGLNLHLALLVWFIGAETGIAAYSAFFDQQGQGSNPGPEGIPLFSDNSKFFWVFVGALLGVITLNSGMAIYHSKDNRAIVAFVAISWTGLVLLFTFLCLYNRAAAGSPRRNRLTAMLWALTTLLTFAFCYVIIGMAGLTLPLALLIWAIAVATGIGAFSVFFE